MWGLLSHWSLGQPDILGKLHDLLQEADTLLVVQQSALPRQLRDVDPALLGLPGLQHDRLLWRRSGRWNGGMADFCLGFQPGLQGPTIIDGRSILWGLVVLRGSPLSFFFRRFLRFWFHMRGNGMSHTHKKLPTMGAPSSYHISTSTADHIKDRKIPYPGSFT